MTHDAMAQVEHQPTAEVVTSKAGAVATVEVAVATLGVAYVAVVLPPWFFHVEACVFCCHSMNPSYLRAQLRKYFGL